ncbi:MAG: DUF4091 domain-containing protein [Acidobacteriota bacterium]|nr:DUF4091 domain-containing protein [Acidobacteriota bacterium]
MSRIWQTSQPGESAQIDLWAAKDETYSFQIGVQAPAGGLTGVNVTTSGLTGPDSQVIAGADIALFREQYMYVPASPPYYWKGKPDGTNPPGPPGWYPDGLIPFVDPETGQPAQPGVLNAVPFNAGEGTNQTIWVDVHVPVNSPAGPYRGVFTVSSDQGNSSIQVTLHVWNFTLPKVPSFKTAYQADLSHQDTYMTHELLRNRVSPEWVDLAGERALIDQWGLGSTNAWFSSGLGIDNCNAAAMPPAPGIAQFLAVQGKHQPDVLLYNFSADEISQCPKQFPALRQWARNMHAAGIQNLVTVMPTPALEDDGTGTGRSAVDIWVELPVQYDRAAPEIAKVLAKGDSVWSYNVLVQDGYSPKQEISFTPLDYRLNMGFISQSLGISGFQQWRVDRWTFDPWNSLSQFQGVYSDGLLVYPGATVGLTGYAPSMRLKWTRDGVNDFEYVQILKSLGQGDWALQQAQSVGPDWRNWTRDYTQVEAIRLALGNKIDQLSSGQVPAGNGVTASPIALVQSNSVEGSGVDSISAAFPATNKGGNLIVAFVRMSTVTQSAVITDSAGNRYSTAIGQTQDADGHQLYIFYARNISGGANVVKAAFSSNNNHPWLAIYEYSGLNTVNPLDRTSAAQGSGFIASTGLAAATAVPNELIFSAAGFPSNFEGTVLGGSGATILRQDTGTARAANKGAIVSSTGSYVGRFSINQSTDWTAVLATFR